MVKGESVFSYTAEGHREDKARFFSEVHSYRARKMDTNIKWDILLLGKKNKSMKSKPGAGVQRGFRISIPEYSQNSCEAT